MRVRCLLRHSQSSSLAFSWVLRPQAVPWERQCKQCGMSDFNSVVCGGTSLDQLSRVYMRQNPEKPFWVQPREFVRVLVFTACWDSWDLTAPWSIDRAYSHSLSSLFLSSLLLLLVILSCWIRPIVDTDRERRIFFFRCSSEAEAWATISQFDIGWSTHLCGGQPDLSQGTRTDAYYGGHVKTITSAHCQMANRILIMTVLSYIIWVDHNFDPIERPYIASLFRRNE